MSLLIPEGGGAGGGDVGGGNAGGETSLDAAASHAPPPMASGSVDNFGEHQFLDAGRLAAAGGTALPVIANGSQVCKYHLLGFWLAASTLQISKMCLFLLVGHVW